MNVSYLERHIKDGGSLPSEIVDEQDIYKFKRDKRACNTLNKVLGTDFKAIYRRDVYYKGHQLQSSCLQLDTGETFVVKQDNSVISINVSEWFEITNVESHKYGS